MFPCFAEHYSIIYYLTIVKPVYNGQPWGITKVAFVWEHIYTVNAFVQGFVKMRYWPGLLE